MATVYLAQDLKHDRRVALKVLRPELAAVIGAERFLAEIRTTANLQHPHILALFDSGQVEGLLYYVMPFVVGETLRERLSRDRQLPVDEAVRFASDVASALDYAHRQGVIHRDIKPENIFLHEGRALLADFGIALAVRSAGDQQRVTQTGISLGTPQYMSPEQALGDRSISARTDVYALGCVLYEMLVGEPPFTGATAQAIVGRILQDAPVPPSRLRPSVPPSVDNAVVAALAKLPADRPQSASAFGNALSESAAAGARKVDLARRVPIRPAGWFWPLLSSALAIIGIAGWLRTSGSAANAYRGPPGCESLDGVWRHADTNVTSGTWITHHGYTLEVVRLKDNPQLAMNRWRLISCTPTEFRFLQLESTDPDPSLRTGAEVTSPYRIEGDFIVWQNPLPGGGFSNELRGERIR